MNLAARLAKLGAATPLDRSNWYRQQWQDAAEHRGWRVRWQSHGFLSLERGDRRTTVRGADAGLDSHCAFRIAGNKALTAHLFDLAGLRHPASSSYDIVAMSDLVSHIKRLGDQAVVKPTAGTGGGRGVTVGPVGSALVMRAIADAASYGRSVSVDERVDGTVVRALVLDGTMVDAVARRPARVDGDGRSSVAQLVRSENERRRALGPLSTGFVPTGADYRSALAAQNLSPSSIVDEGVEVTVAGRSNTGSERESRRIALSEESRNMAVDAAAAVGLIVAGVDLIVNEDGSPWGVLEVNTAPGLHWHVLVAEDPYDPFSAVLRVIEEIGTPARSGS